MLTYARSSDLKAHIDAGVEGAVLDDWLEGWTVGALHSLFEGRWPSKILDVEMGDRTRRPFLDAGIFPVVVRPHELDVMMETYDLVLVLFPERESCLAPLNAGHAFDRIELLAKAARLLAPDGALVWSYLYAYGEDGVIHDVMEPAAVYRSMTLRGLKPFHHPEREVHTRLPAYSDPETMFVDHRTVLRHTDRQHRVVRILGAVRSPPLPSPPEEPPPPPLPWWRRLLGRERQEHDV